MDILPTVIDLAGGRNIAGEWHGRAAPPLPGKSLTPVFTGEGAIARDFLYFHHLSNRALRVGDWKLVAKGDEGPWELYDLQTDRCEQKNLADQYPQRVREMAVQWQKCEDDFRRQAGPAPDEPAAGAKQKNRKRS